jgi:hypothetical protein
MKIKKIGVMCGAKWYRRSDWQLYSLFWWCRPKSADGRTVGFGIGPILFWDGS